MLTARGKQVQPKSVRHDATRQHGDGDRDGKAAEHSCRVSFGHAGIDVDLNGMEVNACDDHRRHCSCDGHDPVSTCLEGEREVVRLLCDEFAVFGALRGRAVRHLTDIIAALRATPVINSVERARG